MLPKRLEAKQAIASRHRAFFAAQNSALGDIIVIQDKHHPHPIAPDLIRGMSFRVWVEGSIWQGDGLTYKECLTLRWDMGGITFGGGCLEIVQPLIFPCFCPLRPFALFALSP